MFERDSYHSLICLRLIKCCLHFEQLVRPRRTETGLDRHQPFITMRC